MVSIESYIFLSTQWKAGEAETVFTAGYPANGNDNCKRRGS